MSPSILKNNYIALGTVRMCFCVTDTGNQSDIIIQYLLFGYYNALIFVWKIMFQLHPVTCLLMLYDQKFWFF